MKRNGNGFWILSRLWLIAALCIPTLILAAMPVQAGVIPNSETRLAAGDDAPGQQMAYSVAEDGGTVVAGTSDFRKGTTSAAYVFVKNGGSWAQQARLTPPDNVAESKFGESVDISGDTIAVAAPEHSNKAGAAYIFTRSGTIWTEQAKLMLPNPASGDFFGYRVSIDGDTLAVAAWGKYDKRGAIYIFQRSGTTWSQQAELTASDGQPMDMLGESIDLDDNTLAAGAGYRNKDQGGVYVFIRQGTTWSQQAFLLPEGATNTEYFVKVSLDGDNLAVGGNMNSTNRGAAYVFTRSGSKWMQQAKLMASDGVSYDYFGTSVSIRGNAVLVGCDGKDKFKGAAYLFEKEAGAWVEKAKLSLADAAQNDTFGFSVALSIDNLFIGAHGWNAYRGAVFVYGFTPPPTNITTQSSTTSAMPSQTTSATATGSTTTTTSSSAIQTNSGMATSSTQTTTTTDEPKDGGGYLWFLALAAVVVAGVVIFLISKTKQQAGKWSGRR
jgi:hypothetical protein